MLNEFVDLSAENFTPVILPVQHFAPVSGRRLLEGEYRFLQKFIISLLGLLLVGPAFAATTADVARGRTLYLRYCAACHGRNADGKGPVAPALKTPPADLRILSKRYGNPLPEDQMARFIDGRADIAAHGPREMPVWGGRVWAHREGEGNEGHVTRAIANLVAYLQSIQNVQQHASVKQRGLDHPVRESNDLRTGQTRLRYSGL